ncbi:hypothetical protein Pfo_030984, partial [Paulownia fortunei]
ICLLFDQKTSPIFSVSSPFSHFFSKLFIVPNIAPTPPLVLSSSRLSSIGFWVPIFIIVHRMKMMAKFVLIRTPLFSHESITGFSLDSSRGAYSLKALIEAFTDYFYLIEMFFMLCMRVSHSLCQEISRRLLLKPKWLTNFRV